MASQRQFSGFIFTILVLMMQLTSQADSAASAPDSGEKVKLSLYYESLCPYCANFIVNHLAKIFRTDLLSIVDLRLVPWGNTQIKPNNTWICQHGVDECQLDVIEACAIGSWPDLEMHFKFIYCIEHLHLMNRHTEWEACFAATGFDRKPLDDCYRNGFGYQPFTVDQEYWSLLFYYLKPIAQFERAYADETANLNPRHRFVPWVVVNNLPLEDDYENFIAYICRAYRGNETPEACKSSLSEKKLPKAAGITINRRE